jgi:hypothetical protein
VQDGIYSFAFGANGTSNALTTETIAIANGTVSTFQKVLAAPTVVAGSVTVTDGTYTWDQTNGSSNESDFSVAYSPNLRRVTVTYYNGAPAAGKTISATYRTPGSGITGAFAQNNQPWIETTVSGTAQAPRQKVLTVPYALFAGSSNVENLANATKIVTIKIRRFAKPNVDLNSGVYPFGQPNASFPLTKDRIEGRQSGQWQIPEYVKKIRTISLKYANFFPEYAGSVEIAIPGSNWSGATFSKQYSSTTVVLPVEIEIPFSETFCINFSITGGGEISEISLIAEVSALAVREN